MFSVLEPWVHIHKYSSVNYLYKEKILKTRNISESWTF